MQFAIVADDLTGATDSGAQLAHAGYRVAVAFHDSKLPPTEDLDAVVVDTDSRQLSPKSARARVSEATTQLKDARILYKKIDSTLRGRVTTEIEAALRESERPNAIIAPAFPGNGRTTVEGVQMVHDEPVHETRFAKDPVTPVREGHIPSLLAQAGLSSVGTLELREFQRPEAVQEALEGYRWVVADATADVHLESLVNAILDPAEVLWVGSAGLVKALGRVYSGPREALPEKARMVDRALIVVGSTNDVSREQLRRLQGKPGVEAVALPASAMVDGRKDCTKNALEEAERFLVGGKSVALYSTDEKVPEGGSGRVVEDLAEVVAGLSGENLFDVLVLTGGDTAVHVSRELGAQGIMLEGEIEPGVAAGTLIGPKPYRVITKAGGFGNPETLLNALNALVGKERQL